ncbi:MAG: spore coat protein U domain-containing protein [Acidobacteria bacterium]|nr:spore coat protein U domain-containing protein [Acidobacteriota bacterium]
METRNRIVRGVAAALGVAGALVLSTGRTDAGSATANLSVSATVSVNCTISTAALAFGSYDPVVTHAASPLDGTGTVTIACTKGSTETIGLGLGANATGSQRRLNDGGTNYLNYELYQDSGHATVWGNSGAGLLSPAAAPSKAARNFSVYGRVASNQDVPAGSYTDTVVATVNF